MAPREPRIIASLYLKEVVSWLDLGLVPEFAAAALSKDPSTLAAVHEKHGNPLPQGKIRQVVEGLKDWEAPAEPLHWLHPKGTPTEPTAAMSVMLSPSTTHLPRHVLWTKFTEEYPRMESTSQAKLAFYISLQHLFGSPISFISGKAVESGYFLQVNQKGHQYIAGYMLSEQPQEIKDAIVDGFSNFVKNQLSQEQFFDLVLELMPYTQKELKGLMQELAEFMINGEEEES